MLINQRHICFNNKLEYFVVIVYRIQKYTKQKEHRLIVRTTKVSVL